MDSAALTGGVCRTFGISSANTEASDSTPAATRNAVSNAASVGKPLGPTLVVKIEPQT